MAASEELARRVVEAGRSCSLTTAVLEEWSRLGTPKQAGYLAGYLEAERSSREASKRATLLRRCALPAPKTFDGYDWSVFFTTTKFRISRLISFGFHRFAKVPHPFFANCPIFPSSRLPRTFCSARRTQPADHDA